MSHSHCNHDHSHENLDEIGIQYNLFEKIDIENLQCLNESIDGAGKTVFKPWEKRLDRTQYVESDADEELLFNIPFTGNIKIKGLRISSEDSDSHPAKLRLFKNRPNMTFDDVAMEPDQVFDLQKDSEGVLEYSPKFSSRNWNVSKTFSRTVATSQSEDINFLSTDGLKTEIIVTFSSVSHLTMHFPTNFGAENTTIYYIGLRGEWTPGHKHGVTICTYEARPMLEDHKLSNIDSVSKAIQ